MTVKYLFSLAIGLSMIQFFYKHIELFQSQQNHAFPINTVPVRYELWIKTDIDKGHFDFSGKVKIHVKVLEATKSVTIHYREIKVTEINLIHRNVTSSLTYSFERQKEFLHITLPDIALANETFIIEISYSGVLRDDLLGFYRSSYMDINNETVWLAATLFEATYARSAFPCYDEPSIRAAISLEIQHDESYHSISNMPVDARNHINGTSYVITKFLDTPPMQTYLLAFVVSNLKHVQSNNGNIPQRIYARPSAIDKGELDIVVQKLDDILRLLEDHFQIPFPMPKLDHVALPGHSTFAMENWGLITYRESKLLVNNDTTQESIDLNFMVVFHEFTHQYFGDLVSIKSWDNLWIIEGIASLYETHLMSLLFPDRAKEFSDYFVLSTVYIAHAIDTDDNENDDKVWPLNRHVETPEEIQKKFNLLVYKKAAAVLRSFQEAIGDETWLKGLRLFLKEMKFKSADASDLHRALQKAYDEDHPGSNIRLGALMETWESQPGFPIVTVRKHGGKLILTQERYPVGNGEIYAIPINYATASNPDFENKTAAVWMTEQQTEMEYDDEWVILNIQNTGYYIVNYDEELWNDITIQLLRNHSSIHYMNRILLLLNHLRAARKGIANMSNVLKMFDYMKFERDLTVWNEADDIIFTLDKAFSEFWFYKEFNEFVRNIVEMNYRINGYNSRSPAVTDWACKTGLEACTKDALVELLHLTNQTKDSPASREDYCRGIRVANETIFRHFWSLLMNSDDETFKLKLISGLACSADEDLLREYLHSTTNQTFGYTDQDRLNIIEVVIENNKGLHIAFDFVLENYEAIHQISEDGLTEAIIPAIAANLNLRNDFEELRKFESLIIARGFASTSYKANIDFYLKLNTDWQKYSFEDVEEFFRQMNKDLLLSAAPSMIELMKSFWKINLIGFVMRVICQRYY